MQAPLGDFLLKFPVGSNTSPLHFWLLQSFWNFCRLAAPDPSTSLTLWLRVLGGAGWVPEVLRQFPTSVSLSSSLSNPLQWKDVILPI